MNLLIVNPSDVHDGRVRVRGRAAQHLRSVLAVNVGDTVRAAVERFEPALSTVVAISDNAIELSMPVTEPISSPRVRLLLAVPRPKAVPRIVAAAAAFGVRCIDLVNAWKVPKSYFDSPRLSPAALRDDALAGCEQGGVSFVPDIDVHPLLMPFLDSLAPPAGERRLVLHPRAAELIEAVSIEPPTDVWLAVGPDGGFTDQELSTLGQRGFLPVRLGDAVLRTEHAVTSAFAQLGLLRRLADAP